MRYERIYGGREVEQGRLLFEKDPVFTTIDENRLEDWRFPEQNYVSKNTLTCHECGDVLIEVLKQDEKGENIEDYRNYPVYIRVNEFYSSRYVNSGVCKPCWKKLKETEAERELEREKRRIARSKKIKENKEKKAKEEEKQEKQT
tara:strand:- start:2640 stop:3074 length:435 start_codon:yes stop_codon:yes gene_type:complete